MACRRQGPLPEDYVLFEWLCYTGVTQNSHAFEGINLFHGQRGQVMGPATTASGLKWEKIGTKKPLVGQLINRECKKLVEALKRASGEDHDGCEFSQEEWDSINPITSWPSTIGIDYMDLTTLHYIKSGDSYFKPAATEALPKSTARR